VVRLLVYVASIATLPVLHRKIGEYEDQFRLPGGMAIPVLAVLVSLWLMSHAPLESWLVTAVFMGVGAVVYAFARRAAERDPG
jgi:amino acid transporter